MGKELARHPNALGGFWRNRHKGDSALGQLMEHRLHGLEFQGKPVATGGTDRQPVVVPVTFRLPEITPDGAKKLGDLWAEQVLQRTGEEPMVA